MRRQVLRNTRAGQIMRVQFVARRHRHFAHERLVGVDEIKAAAHDVEQVFQHRAARAFIECEAAQIALPPVDVVQQLARFNQLAHHLLLADGETLCMKRHIDALPFGEAFGLIVEGASARILRGRSTAQTQ